MPATDIPRARHRRRAGKHAESGHDLSVIGGLAALSLDALSSVAYGPEAMVLVLVSGGASALRFTLPITIVITAMLFLLVVSYSQVIAAHRTGAAPTRSRSGTWAGGPRCWPPRRSSSTTC